ncbi:hypothetical protein D3C85_755610 [compost metagenome]
MVALGVIALYHAFVLSTLWAWFVVPLGAIKISLAHAYGLSLIPAVLLGSRGIHAPAEQKKQNIATALLIPAFALFFGWIALGFM